MTLKQIEIEVAVCRRVACLALDYEGNEKIFNDLEDEDHCSDDSFLEGNHYYPEMDDIFE